VAGVFSVEDGLRLIARRGSSPQIQCEEPQVEIISGLTGQRVGAAQLRSASYWQGIDETVGIQAGMKALRERGFEAFLEIRPALTDFRQMMATLARLYVNGVDIDWPAFYKGRTYCPIAMPTYPFQRTRYWIAERRAREKPARMHSARRSHPLLGRRLRSVLADVQFESSIGTEALPWLADHQIYGHPLVPAAAFLEMAMACAGSVLGRGGLEVRDLAIEEPLLLDDGLVTVQSAAKPLPGGTWSFEIYSAAADTPENEPVTWRPHVRAILTRANPAMGSAEAPATSFERLRERCNGEIKTEALYAAAHKLGLELGPAFRGIEQVRQGPGEAFGAIRLPAASSFEREYGIHPALLDSALQLVLAAATGAADGSEVSLPIGVERFTLSVHAPSRLFGHAQLRGGPGPDITKADIRLFDEDGLDVGAIVGLAVRRASRAALDRAVQREEADWLNEIEWRRQPIAPEPVPVEAGRSWLILSAGTGIGEKLAARFRAAGDACRSVPAERFRNQDNFGQPFSGVVYVVGPSLSVADLTSTQLSDIQRSVCQDALHIAQALAGGSEGPPPRLWFVTENEDVAHSTIWGLAKAIATEHPELGCTCVGVEDVEAATSMEFLFHEIRRGGDENQVALRGAMRYVPRLVRKGTPSINTELRSDRTWVVTGGLGALGLLITGQLLEQGVRHLVLVGRSVPSAETARRISDWEHEGARVVVSQTDVTDEGQLRQLLSSIANTMPPLRGVVHAAGVLDDGVFLQQSWDRFERVMAPKVLGAWNLHRLTRDVPLDHFILFSSMASVLGSAGQSNYAAANAFLDGLAHHRRAKGLPALSVNWSPWAGTGMAAGSAMRAIRGLKALSPAGGCRVFRRLLATESAQIAVLPVRWPAFLEQFASGIPPLLSDFAQWQTRGVEPAREAELLRRLEDAPAEERAETLLSWLQELAARVLGLPDAVAADQTKPLHELGMDSLMAVEIRNFIGAAIGRTPPATLLFDYPTVEGISGYLRAEVLRMEFADAATQEAAPQAARNDSRADRVADLTQMDEDEVQELLVGKLRAWTKGKSA